MKTTTRTAAFLIAAATAAANASMVVPDGQIITGTITADNHYALYSSTGSDFQYHGGNETGASGNPGRYNWSVAEGYSFESGDQLYIAAWSDDRVAQGVLAELHSDSLGTILSGDPRWQVYATNASRGTGDLHPGTSEIAQHVAFADANELWQSTVTGGANGAGPWNTIAGIDAAALWMWHGVEGVADPLRGAHGAGEMMIFRTALASPPPVPAPGAVALIGIGGLLMTKRRR
jgi:hypothetical protein